MKWILLFILSSCSLTMAVSGVNLWTLSFLCLAVQIWLCATLIVVGRRRARAALDMEGVLHDHESATYTATPTRDAGNAL